MKGKNRGAETFQLCVVRNRVRDLVAKFPSTEWPDVDEIVMVLAYCGNYRVFSSQIGVRDGRAALLDGDERAVPIVQEIVNGKQ